MTSLSTVPLSIKLLLFFLILCPGVYIGDVLLNICDVYIPVLFLYVLITRRPTYWYMNNTVRWLWLYVGVAILSICVASVGLEEVQWGALLKWLRLLYLPSIYIIVAHLIDRQQIRACLKNIVVLGGCTALLGIILYIQQSEWYRTPQTMVSLTGEIIYRAGGVFAEPGQFSLVLVMVFIITNVMWTADVRYRFLYVVVMLLCLWGLMVTYSRIAVIALMVFFLYRICMSWLISWRARVKSLAGIAVLVALAISFYQFNEEVAYTVDERVLPLMEISSQAELADLSAGRAGTWTDNLTHFLYQEQEYWLFGRGYKIEEYNIGIYSIDNNFLYALLHTGFIGGGIFVLFWICLLYDCLYRRFDKTDLFAIIMGGCTLALFLYCLTSDAVTMYRGMGVFMLLYAMSHVRVTDR